MYIINPLSPDDAYRRQKHTVAHFIYPHNRRGEPLRNDALVTGCLGGFFAKKVVTFRAALPPRVFFAPLFPPTQKFPNFATISHVFRTFPTILSAWRSAHTTHGTQEDRGFDMTPMGGAWASPARGQGHGNTRFSGKRQGAVRSSWPKFQAKREKQSSRWPPEAARLGRERSQIWRAWAYRRPRYLHQRLVSANRLQTEEK